MFVIIDKKSSLEHYYQMPQNHKINAGLDIYCSHKHLLIFIFSSGDFNINLKKCIGNIYVYLLHCQFTVQSIKQGILDAVCNIYVTINKMHW